MDIVAELSSSNIAVFLDLDLMLDTEVFFSISTVPQMPIISNSSTIIQLTLLYNVLYNISIVPTLCGQTGAITLIQLKYSEYTQLSIKMIITHECIIYIVNCGYPRISDGSVTLMNLSDPATPGMSVTFSCFEHLIITGPNSTTCMENGKWEPDPRAVKCKGITPAPSVRNLHDHYVIFLCMCVLSITLCTCTANCGPIVPPLNGYVNNYTSTVEDTNVTFVCEQNIDNQIFTVANCNEDGSWHPNPSEFCLDAYYYGTIILCVCVHMYV